MTAGPLDALADTAPEEDPDSDRHKIEAAVLATVYREGMTAPGLWEAFQAAEFSTAEHRALADALKHKTTDREPDPFIILEEMKAGGVSFTEERLKDILGRTATVEGALSRLEKMNRADNKNHLIRTLKEAARNADKDNADPDAIRGEILKSLLDPPRNMGRTYPTEAEAVPDLVKKLEERRASEREFMGLDSGFKHLNEVLNGLPEGLYILAGAPSTGKTTLAKQIADQVAGKEQTPVLFWSFEQSREELEIKSLARLASVDSRPIWKGRTDRHEWEKVREAANSYAEGPGKNLKIIEAGRHDTVDRIRAVAQAAKYKKADSGPILLVIDYLQIIPAAAEGPDNKREQVDAILSDLRRLARDLKSPVLVLSSLNRQAYKADKKPSLGGLKESGGIEYSADGVIILHRDDDESEKLTKDYGRPTVKVEARILKNRNGELATVHFTFTPAWALFDETATEALEWSEALGKDRRSPIP